MGDPSKEVRIELDRIHKILRSKNLRMTYYIFRERRAGKSTDVWAGTSRHIRERIEELKKPTN